MLNRAIARLALCAALICTALFTIVPSATADECRPVEIDIGDGETTWIEDCGDSGGDGGDNDDGDGGGGYEPQCDFSVFDHIHDDATFWCEGTTACWGNFPSVLPEDMWDQQTGEPSPGDGYIMTYVECEPAGSGDWAWALPPEDQGPSLWDLAWMAHGSLAVPEFAVGFSPPAMSYVNLPTWYWAEGPGDGEIVGESGGSVAAIATPDHLEVDPGDGSGPQECPFTVSQGDACQHIYERASVHHPEGYPAQMRLVYDLAFTNNGEPLELDGLPTSLESGWTPASLPVGEVSAIVID